MTVNAIWLDGWQCKEDFYAIWDTEDRATAEAAFDVWKARIPETVRPEFDKLAKTVENWRTEIFAFFDHPFTNAYTEARNRLIKDLSRAGRGYSFARIRAKALLALPITSKPLLMCQSCLRVFEEEWALGMNHYTDPKTKERFSHILMCFECNWRFHTGMELHPSVYPPGWSPY